MISYPNINPILFVIGPFKMHWYGVMYLIGIGCAWVLALTRLSSSNPPLLTKAQLYSLVCWISYGLILGGRLGYIIFYDIKNIHLIFRIWEGGMSFHGGLVGVSVAGIFYSKKNKIPYFKVMDFIAPLVPIGLGTGRIGNFINGELFGKPSNVPWAMVFPNAGPLSRHPSQLYEFLLEGVLLFIILWLFSIRPRPIASICGLFLLLYGIFRFCIEFIRIPDIQLGYLAYEWVTMGQILCIPMIILGIVLITFSYLKKYNYN